MFYKKISYIYHWSGQKLLFEFKDIEYKVNGMCKKVPCCSLKTSQVLVIQGRSGSGKSTFLKVLSRLYPHTSGKVFLNNKSWNEYSCEEWRSKVHYMTQKPIFFNETVYNNLKKPFNLKINKNKTLNVKMAKELISSLLLQDSILEQNSKTLSGGELARLVLVRAILVNPEVILLDEPTASLDKKSKKAFYGVLSKWLETQKKAAVIVSHDNNFNYLKDVCYLIIN